MKKRLSPLCLILMLSFSAFAQSTTPNGWKYETLKPGSGPNLSPEQGALTHNELVDANGKKLVSTYQIGVPDYQLISELSPAFQKAFSVMKEGGKYLFTIPMDDFRQAMRSSGKLQLSGSEVQWKMELLEILPPLPDGARMIAQEFRTNGPDAAYARFSSLQQSKSAYLGEWEVNQIGYLFLNQGHHDMAIKAFLYNTQQHPRSGNAFDSLAEAYYQAGDTEKAVRHYQRSLELNPDNANARKMLSKLE
jgi:tetratricopeptide (TPR) repeat protein